MTVDARWLLRPMTAADADLLLAWRNDPTARAASHSQAPVAPAAHAQWVATTLASADRRVLIAELDGAAVGMARLDRETEGHQLSWYMSGAARGKGLGRKLLAEVLVTVPGPVRAEIKSNNLASVRIAEAVGFRLQDAADGVLHFRAG